MIFVRYRSAADHLKLTTIFKTKTLKSKHTIMIHYPVAIILRKEEITLTMIASSCEILIRTSCEKALRLSSGLSSILQQEKGIHNRLVPIYINKDTSTPFLLCLSLCILFNDLSSWFYLLIDIASEIF